MKRLSDKASWRLYVILPIVVFALGMIVMVTISMTRKIDLVADNYYEQELKYQQQIDMKNNSSALEKVIRVESGLNSAFIICDSLHEIKGMSGEIKFYRPSDASMDFAVSFLPDAAGRQVVTHPNLNRGLWKMRLNLSANGELYAIDRSIFIE